MPALLASLLHPLTPLSAIHHRSISRLNLMSCNKCKILTNHSAFKCLEEVWKIIIYEKKEKLTSCLKRQPWLQDTAADLNFELPIRKICIHVIPVHSTPASVSQYSLYQQQVWYGITNSLQFTEANSSKEHKKVPKWWREKEQKR